MKKELLRFIMCVVIIVTSSSSFSAVRYEHCGILDGDKLRAECFVENLRRSDAEINRTYELLMVNLDKEAKIKLRGEQRRWLKHRDKMCVLDSRISSREAWYQAILQDYFKTVCVLRLTGSRQQGLEYEVAKLGTRSTVARGESSSPASGSKAVYDVYGLPPQINGKWYFEVKFDVAEVVKIGDAAIFVGVVSKKQSTGKLVKIRPDSELPNFGIKLYTVTKNVGIAVDLDNGKLYVRENGSWHQGSPGSSGGLDLKLGREYRAVVSSSVRLDSLLQKGIVATNFGGPDFTYSLPDGYSAFGPITLHE